MVLICNIEVKKVIPDAANPNVATPSFQYAPQDKKNKADDNIPVSIRKLN
jgi:hypothetical protein